MSISLRAGGAAGEDACAAEVGPYDHAAEPAGRLRRPRVRSTRQGAILGRGLMKGAFVALLCGLLLAPRVAWAEPTEADRATARSLASEGYDALERKDYATAVDRFRHA